MRMGSLSRGRAALWAAALVLTCGRGVLADSTVIVYANNGFPGDSYTNTDPYPPTTNLTIPIGSSGWKYDNLRQQTTIGVNTTFAHDGDGSVYFNSNSPTGVGKADIALGSFVASGVSLGSLSSLTALAYDWYRSSASTNSAVQAPSLRIYVSNGTNSGYLVWEPTYNGVAVTTDVWHTSDAFAGGTGLFWANGSIPGAADPIAGLKTISDWKSLLSGYYVTGINSGVGSGWNGQFIGAVDDIKIGFDGVSTTYNFEVVPEPSSVALSLIAGACGLAEAVRRRRSR
ncbi:PEP-CTERM sorting domain-containing protein [Paludisphaera rhizosphaerae]|uniref:PEP-CTERM sorting domain-containing protein n=1 Tax=Paludisphaera rhizosphaerae TaxID=2711216 RepID=UPI0013EDC088|nr:PEP-CTERM sorting domain-containing protein [Paludisphaera rhizosphaerae]